MITVGLVGFGLAGRILHAPLIAHAGMRIVGVVTRQVQAVRETLPAAVAVPDIEALLQLDALDLVVIASPNEHHAQQAGKALAAGKHVVIDKPLAVSVAQADELIQMAASAQRQLAVFHNRRWDSDFLTLRELISNGSLGDIVSYEARWDRFRPQVAERWREQAGAGAGILFDLGPHLIDQALCLFGMPEWLQADVFTQRPNAVVDDGFEIRMGKGPLRISLGVSSLVVDNALRYRVHGTQGSFRKSGLDVQEEQLRQGVSPADASYGIEPETQWGCLVPANQGEHTPIPAVRGDWSAFYRAMRASIESNAPVPVSAHAARNVLKLIELARISSETGQRLAVPAALSA